MEDGWMDGWMDDTGHITDTTGQTFGLMDKVDPYLNQLLREWQKMYNSI
ncbi:hypothetical protein HNP24_001279 [Chryseobacterium sediminis]|uniref:Uncharacterized protein n=1 Tax=Chryseobacterium sediminis TaxID=1679494 RepID=A0ABR6PX80_9FLAO|nr:hypothetical protein [Chryseobacterium sediminis]